MVAPYLRISPKCTAGPLVQGKVFVDVCEGTKPAAAQSQQVFVVQVWSTTPKCLCCNWGQKLKCIKIPSHPQAGLTRRHRHPTLSSFFRSITLCKNSCCLTGDVFIKLSELIQVQNSRSFHDATCFIYLKIEELFTITYQVLTWHCSECL